MTGTEKEHERFGAWNTAIAGQLDPGPTEQGFHDLIASILAFDVLMVFEYREGEAGSVFHTVADKRSKVIIDDYLLGPFLLDPFYAHSTTNRQTGLMVMSQLSPDQFHKSEFYRQHYHLTGIVDEIGIGFEVNPGSRTVVSITRSGNQPCFSDSDRSLFENAGPVLGALARKLWKTADTNAPSTGARQLKDAFDEFGRDVLSKREVEVASLILKGHSSLSIGETLDISPGTVKIHRKHIYSKLNISSQAELFNTFIQHFSAS